jgi:hypothetical protein
VIMSSETFSWLQFILGSQTEDRKDSASKLGLGLPTGRLSTQITEAALDVVEVKEI